MLGKRHLLVFIICMAIAGGALALVAPKDGNEIPMGLREMMEKNPEGFTVTRGWAQKVERIKREREAFLAVNGPQALSALRSEHAVTGTMAIPVLLCEFANRPGPFDSLAVQTKLFSGTGGGTVTDYYDEVSYGLLNMTGTVYDWVTLSNNDTYYEGPPTCNGLCSQGQMGALLQETLTAKDPEIDFSQYDNDGPDGTPNSGDDDGFVDFVAFVHSEYGAECDRGNNLWSHQYIYSGWPQSGGLPFVTNDAAAGGGFIQINEYTLQPVRDCPPDNATMNEIGVFCHEFGHAFGLPDLYDYNGGTDGIGRWGIMGSGNWNQPDSPAHPSAYTRLQLGWVTPTDVTWDSGTVSIDAIATSGDVFRLGFTQNRFRRSNECVINGSFSLYCGLSQAEGLARGWGTDATDRGYGNAWDETIEREFTYDGTGPVNFSYNYQHHTETGWDFCYASIEVAGFENVLDSFDGAGAGSASHDISTYLSGLSAGDTYIIRFGGRSDAAWADEDGYFKSNCGMFVVDDVSVTGGGESYSTGFETVVDGWYQSSAANPPREYWLVENRQVFGFDAHLFGTGLLVMHIDEPIIEAPFLGNSGGDFASDRAKGVAIEEADGQNNLVNGGDGNRGDDGDVYPGSSNNRTFNSSSTPNSNSNANVSTRIVIDNISDSGSTMTANMKAGDPPPIAQSSSPSPIDNNQTAVPVVVTGQEFAPGATFYYNHGGVAASGPSMAPADSENIVATSIRWIDSTRLEGTINVYSKTGGQWDLIVTNPDGQQSTLSEAITINQLVAAQLQSASIEVVGDAIRLEYELFDRDPGERIRLSRSPQSESIWHVLVNDLQPESDESGRYVYVDADVEPGKKYYYKLDVVEENGSVRELHRGNAAVPAGEMTLAQNFPNPFNPTTTISFYLPNRLKVSLEVFDVAGRLVTRLGEGIYQAGPHELTWNGTNANGTPVSSGVYVYRLTAGNRSMTKKMVLLK